ncbi:hypothetical protein [Sedimentitalea nanhaiensis]|uniref:Uncharacterized protein n=1 Tax=Sedimentitalea nanhaiensis TaxID=999627 RepID=A0A1I7E403_9RHOB|nr:hypothetical protein [Sedimentitalea nanhaiensis]SFU18658.1 hypothetical protein SAMN05216236_14332 [Sedimentitalea nanhaiensis]
MSYFLAPSYIQRPRNYCGIDCVIAKQSIELYEYGNDRPGMCYKQSFEKLYDFASHLINPALNLKVSCDTLDAISASPSLPNEQRKDFDVKKFSELHPQIREKVISGCERRRKSPPIRVISNILEYLVFR